MGVCHDCYIKTKKKNDPNGEGKFILKATKIINNNGHILDDLNSKKSEESIIKEEKNIHSNNILKITSEQSEKILKQSKIYICKIMKTITDKDENIFGTGFLCKIPFPDKNHCLPVLMTNEHVVSKDEINEINFKITFDNDKFEKIINLNDKRRIYSKRDDYNDLTIIEIYPIEDKIFHFFDVDIIDAKNNGEPIYILQYPNGKKCSISYGKICDVQDNEIYHDCSTIGGSSGGPILSLRNYNLIGIHKGYDKSINLNLGGLLENQIEEFNLTFQDKKIKNNYANCIICEYNIKKGEEFYLLNDYNNGKNINEEFNRLYNQSKTKKNLLAKIINIYIDDNLIKFNYKYKTNKTEIKVKFIFTELINDLGFLFYNCKKLKSVDLSPYNAINVENLSYMFGGCESLESIDLFSFNTKNVINMCGMFSECESLKSIDLSSFNTTKVKDMNKIFFKCSSIRKLDLTSFKTINVINMNNMFSNCYSLKFLYLSSFKTKNVIDMGQMFSRCSSLQNLDLSKFDTKSVINMDGMFEFCSNLKFVNLSSFNTTNVTNMKLMFNECSSLKSLDLSSFNTNNVENMLAMFSGARSLETLDLSSFNTSKVSKMAEIFAGCLALKNLKCYDNNILSSFKNINMLNYFKEI